MITDPFTPPLREPKPLPSEALQLLAELSVVEADLAAAERDDDVPMSTIWSLEAEIARLRRDLSDLGVSP